MDTTATDSGASEKKGMGKIERNRPDVGLQDRKGGFRLIDRMAAKEKDMDDVAESGLTATTKIVARYQVSGFSVGVCSISF